MGQMLVWAGSRDGLGWVRGWFGLGLEMVWDGSGVGLGWVSRCLGWVSWWFEVVWGWSARAVTLTVSHLDLGARPLLCEALSPQETCLAC
jgi:hypothetical protein